MKEKIRSSKTMISRITMLAGCGLAVVCLLGQGTQVHSRTDRQNSQATVEYIHDTASGETENILASLPETFIFTSGVGAWGTELSIAEDGTFVGKYQDTNMGDIGNGYPNGSVYICDFSGRFSDPVRVNQYVYAMNLETLEMERTAGETYIQDGIRYVYSTPYGVENGKDFFLYLPGTPITSVAQGFLSWAHLSGDETQLPTGFYGLYNVQEQCGFRGTKGDDQAVQSTEGGSASDAGTNQGTYILPESNTRYLTDADLSVLTSKEICYAKNEIYARHGRKFLSSELTAYFNSQPWYQGTIEPEDFTEDTLNRLFNEYEKVNVRFISDWEKAHGEYAPQ